MSTGPTMDEVIERATASVLYAFTKAAVQAGATPNQAFRLAAFGVIEMTLGREASRSLGLPEATARRWRRELAALDGDAIPEDMPDELLNEMLPFLGFPDLRVHRIVPEGGADDGQG